MFPLDFYSTYSSPCSEKKYKEDVERFRKERPKIQQEFSDLKRELKNVSEDEWMNIPEVGDWRNRKMRNKLQEKYVCAFLTLLQLFASCRLTPVPDSILMSNVNSMATSSSIDQRVMTSGLMTPIGGMQSTIPGMMSVIPGTQVRPSVFPLRLSLSLPYRQ